MSELRKCKVRDFKENEINALFHMFYIDADCEPYAIIETQDGSVKTYHADRIKFIKSQETPEIFPGTSAALNKIKI